MKKRIVNLACWILAAAAGAVLVAGAASGQATRPATQPTQPAPAAEIWTPRTVQRPFGVYLVSGGVSVTVTADDSTWVCTGPVWSSNGAAPLTLRADRVLVRVRCNQPNAPASGPIKVGPCVRDFGADNVVAFSSADAADTFVEAWPGSERLVLLKCKTTSNLRAGAFYSAGAVGSTVLDCDFTSRAENTVRWSPQNGIVSRDALVLRSWIANVGSKAAVEFRNVIGAQAVGNTLLATRNNSCVGVGHAHAGDPGADDVVIRDNQCIGGAISLHAEARNVDVEGNVARWDGYKTLAARPDNSFITVDSIGGSMRDITLLDNSGVMAPGVPPKALIAYARPRIGNDFGPEVKPPGLVEARNAWQPAPATQPTTRPATQPTR